MIRAALIALLFPVRLRVASWHDPRTFEERRTYARVFCRTAQRRKSSTRPDLHVRTEHDTVPEWLTPPDLSVSNERGAVPAWALQDAEGDSMSGMLRRQAA